MTRVAVSAIGKKYKVYPQRWGRLMEWMTANRYTAHRAEWALRDISFEVRDGECVGVIGMNGAGKSTLLKILTGTTQPTEGSVAVSGQVSALLELGLGMHPEFSGWENAVLACQLMGLAPAMINECLPWIQSFSELGEHMDQPVRTYSTGMQVRLAFSAATVVRPDVLVVDEALAVGDAYFQHKSLSRIRSFTQQGTTLVFVTHDAAALKAVCGRAILLDSGRLLRDGPADAVFDYYNALIAQREADAGIRQSPDESGHTVTRSGSKEAEIVSVEVCGAAGRAQRLFRVGESATIRYRIRVHQPMTTPTLGFLIRDRLGADVFGTNTYHLGIAAQPWTAGDDLEVSFDVTLNLGPGDYSISAGVHRGPVHVEGNFDWWDRAAMFQVISDGALSFAGVAALPTRAAVRAVSPSHLRRSGVSQ